MAAPILCAAPVTSAARIPPSGRLIGETCGASRLLLGDEAEGGGVDAIPQPRRPRSVGKDMAEMRRATRAMHFGAGHEQAAVGLGLDILGVRRLPEARPSRAGVELGRGLEEGRPAADAGVRPLLVIVPIGAREGALQI